jgi:hypothetical protein
MILAIIAGAVVILLIVAGWCAWRFLKKKRPKGADEKVTASFVYLGGFKFLLSPCANTRPARYSIGEYI